MNDQTFPQVPRPTGWSELNEARYRAVARAVLQIEGGHSNDPVDRGGETKYGVSLRFLKAEGKLDVNRDGFADLDLNFDTVLDGADIRLLTPAIATEVFLRHFYIGPGFWRLAAPFDGAMFDQAVNSGTTAAIRILQRALNRVGGGAILDVDGKLGPLTQRKFADCLSRRSALIAAIRDEARRRYEAIVAADPTQRKYINGWRARARALGHV